MTWRYMNPGFVSLLSSQYPATQYNGYEYSNTGYAFATANDTNRIIIPLPVESQVDETWTKVDFFSPDDSSFRLDIPYHYECRFSVKLLTDGSTSCDFIYDTNIWHYTSNHLITASDSLLGIKRNAVSSVAFHIVYGDESTAKAEIMFSTGEKYTSTGYAIPFMNTYSKITIDATNVHKFSNIICSDEEIAPTERIAVSLPASATETTMAATTDGMYSAKGIGQTFLQTPDVSSLINRHGANSRVTSIQVRGNPAYRTGTGLANMISLSKSGNTITEHNTIAVGTTPTNSISDTWRLSGVTLGDLQNMQFGWKAAR